MKDQIEIAKKKLVELFPAEYSKYINKHLAGDFACEIVNRMEVGLIETKRERFAGRAMQGLLANGLCEWSPLNVAMEALECADALLEELAKEKP